MAEDEWPGGAANAAFPRRFQQVGSGAAADDAVALTLAVDKTFTIEVALPRSRAGTVASLAGQLVLQSHEPDETAVLDVLKHRLF